MLNIASLQFQKQRHLERLVMLVLPLSRFSLGLDFLYYSFFKQNVRIVARIVPREMYDVRQEYLEIIWGSFIICVGFESVASDV